MTVGTVMLLGVLLVVFCTVLPTARGERHKMQQQKEYQQLGTQQNQGGRDGVEVDMSTASAGIKRGYIEVSGATVSFLGNLGESPSTMVPDAHNVLLLHGAKYRAENWELIGTLGMLSDAGYRVAAVDLPTKVLHPPRDELLEQICNGLGMTVENPAVIVSPSMSGSFSIPLLLRKPTLFKGYVPVAPVIALSYTRKDFEAVKGVPALIVYGEADHMGAKASDMLSAIPSSEVVMISDAAHPAYIDQPVQFHAKLLGFMQESVFRE